MNSAATNYNKLLARQIKKHLPQELWEDERLQRFIQSFLRGLTLNYKEMSL